MGGMGGLSVPKFTLVCVMPSPRFYGFNRTFLDVLDGAMVILAIYALNIAHPGLLLADSESQEKQAIATA